MIQLHITATVVDVVLILVAIAIATMLGLPIMWVLYSIAGAILLGVVDMAFRVRRSVAYVIGMRLGNDQREAQELRQQLQEAQREQKQASSVVDSLSQRNVEQREPVTVTRNYVPYDAEPQNQECIADALLIFDTAMSGRSPSRESMCPGTMSQDRWDTGKEWLVGAKVLIYKTRRTKTWATTDRATAKGMLILYSRGRVT